MADYSNIPRDSRRVPIATKVQFKFDRFSGFISEYSSNISPTGMYIVTDSPEPAGRILDLEFRLGDGFEIIKGQGEVVWARTVSEGPGRPPGMGIRFLELSPGSQELIYRIVDRYVAQGGTPFDLTGVRHAPAAHQAAPPPPSSPSSDTALPPLSQVPDPFPDLEPEPGREASGTVLPWSPFLKETAMPGGDVLPPLEPLDEVFRLEEVPAGPAPAPAAPTAQTVLTFPGSPPAPAPTSELLPPLDPDLDLTQAGPTVVGFDEPIPDPPSYSGTSLPASSSDDLFASYLPQPAAHAEAPPVRPLSTLAGGASVEQPRRLGPWILVAVLLAVGAAAFLLRDQLPGWLGLGGGDEEIVTAEQRPPLPRRAAPPPPTTLQEDVNLTSDAASTLESPDSAPPAPPVESAPPSAQASKAPADEPEPQRLPEVVQRKPASAPPAGPAATAIERITFEQALGGTTVILWGNGAIRPENFKQIDVDSPPREVIQIRGVRRPFAPTRIPVGTSEVKQIRVGYHERPGGNELHIVIDLARSGVRVARIEPDGQRLRIHLQGR
ncbi:MAG TPA: PilZ domain-containing protein [Thermoanaerobaculia bacterium]|nr:PilZ domain-containing protein [Thermoanaerobaculia bacterium]